MVGFLWLGYSYFNAIVVMRVDFRLCLVNECNSHF